MNNNENSTQKSNGQSERRREQPERVSPHSSASDPADEMRRAMEAARERMKKSQAVYGRPADEPGTGETG